MGKVLKYILPLLCFVAFINSNDTAASGDTICETIVNTMVGDACISTDEPECILARPTPSVNGLQRVQKSSRQNNTSQRRCGAFLKAGRVVHPHLYDNTYINQNLKAIAFPETAQLLIHFGRLII